MDIIKSPETHEKNAVIKGTLYLVGTPIGNLSDLSERAKKVLSEVDFIAAEDTRVSGAMLSKFGIKKPFYSYYEHNKKQKGEGIAERLAAGVSCALVTDAGMPAISDPGEDIVRLCAERGIPVSVIPGPCAAVSALAVSGLFTGKFAFEGFLPTDKKEKKEILEELKEETRTTILYEAPHRLVKTLNELFEVLGDRRVTLCRELTKKFETVLPTTLAGALRLYETEEPRGEYVLVLEGRSLADKKQETIRSWQEISIEEHMKFYENGGSTRKEAMKAVAADRGLSKREIYRYLLEKES